MKSPNSVPQRSFAGLAVALVGIVASLAAAHGGQSPPLHSQVAETALAEGDAETAKRELRLSLQDNPLDARSHLLLASLLGQEGDLDQAIVGFQRTSAIEPNNPVALYNLGTALLLRGEPVLAARRFEDAIAIRPDHVPTYNNLAKAYFLAGIPELSFATYNEALRRDPSNRVARAAIALLTTAAAAAGQPEPGSGGRSPQRAAPPSLPPGEENRGASADDPIGAPTEPDSTEAPEVLALRELIRDLPHVTAERRGDQLAVSGWTSGTRERALLDRILAIRADVLDLSTTDEGDPHRLLEVDATIFKVIGIDSESAGHNFLRRIQFNASLADGAMAAFNWMYTAVVSYDVNIANALNQRIGFLARPHLTTLSGTPATFVAGGDIVYKVTGNIGGDIKPYPFGTTLDVTPTLLRSRDDNGGPRIRVVVRAGRRTLLPIAEVAGADEGSTVFENISVTSEAVLNLNQTLILTGLSQREQRTTKSGVPGLRSIPIIKYLFSETSTFTTDLAIIILLTPRDPAFWDEKNRKENAEFVEKRQAYVLATQGTPDDMLRFKERHPDWGELAPNRFASHLFLMGTSDTYRRVNGVDLATDELEMELLSTKSKSKSKSKSKAK